MTQFPVPPFVALAVPVVDEGLVPSEVLGIVLAAVVAWQTVYWTRDKGQS